MKQIKLAVSHRNTTGKEAARKMRVAGQVPAVIYGAGKPGESLTVELANLQKVLRQVSGSVAFLELEADSGKRKDALLQEVQTDYLGRKILHVDFYEVSDTQELTLDIPLNFIGTPKGVDEGGLVNTAYYAVTLKGTIKDIPDELEVDISELGLDEALYIADLNTPEKVEAVFEENYPLVSVALPKITEEELEEGEEDEEGEGGEDEAAEASEESES